MVLTFDPGSWEAEEGETKNSKPARPRSKSPSQRSNESILPLGKLRQENQAFKG